MRFNPASYDFKTEISRSRLAYDAKGNVGSLDVANANLCAHRAHDSGDHLASALHGGMNLGVIGNVNRVAELEIQTPRVGYLPNFKTIASLGDDQPGREGLRFQAGC